MLQRLSVLSQLSHLIVCTRLAHNPKLRKKRTGIHKKIQQDATVYQTFIIPYLYEAQHVSGDTVPIIKSLKTALAASGFSYVEGCC